MQGHGLWVRSSFCLGSASLKPREQGTHKPHAEPCWVAPNWAGRWGSSKGPVPQPGWPHSIASLLRNL